MGCWASSCVGEALLALALGTTAGFIATLLGIGGGTIIVPLLLMAGVDIKRAVTASLVAVLGTSAGGLRYLHARGLVNVKMALILETATTAGALAGVGLYGLLSSRGLTLAFAGALMISAIGFYARQRIASRGEGPWRPPGPWRLAGALSASFGAGMLSAMLGIGGGVVKVPVLVLILGMPIHQAVSTSKLMIGITAAVGVAGHALKGNVDWGLALPLAAGTYIGGTASSRILVRTRPRVIYHLAIAYYIAMTAYLVYRVL